MDKPIVLNMEEAGPYFESMLASGNLPEQDRIAVEALVQVFQEIQAEQNTSNSERKTSDSEPKTSKSKKKKSKSKKKKSEPDQNAFDNDRKMTEAEYEKMLKEEAKHNQVSSEVNEWSVIFFLLFSPCV